jgi:cytochrome o ubiquinol oxidase subunit II
VRSVIAWRISAKLQSMRRHSVANCSRAGNPGFRVSLALLSLWAASLTAGCSQGILNPRGPIAAAEKTIFLNSVGIMLTIIVPVIIATLGVAWWYRSSNERARYRPEWAYSGKIEIVTWSIPAMVILLLGGVAWVSSHDLDPPRPILSRRETIEVNVVSLDWKWLFIYPQHGVASVNRLVLPVGSPVSFKLTSATVMNSFFVPQLGSQIYTMPGMTTRLNLLAAAAGEYPGLSAQFSGDGFSGMHFVVSAVPDVDFATWIDATRNGGPSLDNQTYVELVKPSKYVAPFTYRSFAPDLFNSIVEMRVPGLHRLAARRKEPKQLTSISKANEICSAN